MPISGQGQAWVSLERHDESYFTKALYVKATFNTRCELLGGLSGQEVKGCCTKVGGINPLGSDISRSIIGASYLQDSRMGEVRLP